MLKPRVALVFAVLAAVVGCNSVESGNLDTDEMRASIAVAVAKDGGSVQASAIVSNQSLTFVDFDGDDVLSAKSGDLSVDLVENNLLGVFAYRGTLDDVGPGDEVTVALVRGEGKASAPESKVIVPEPLTIEAPAAATSFSRANDDIVVDLGGPEQGDADSLTIEWTGGCIDTGSVKVPVAQRSITIPAGSIEQLPQPEDPEAERVDDDCQLTLTVTGRVEGTLDPAWGGGGIAGTASDARTYTTTP